MSTEENFRKVPVGKVNGKEASIGDEQREMLRALLERVVKEMVPHPEDISVSYSCGERTTVYTIGCSQRVLGHIIGSRGKNIQSVRNIVQGISAGKGFRSIVEIPYYPSAS